MASCLSLMCVLLTGCLHPPAQDPARVGPFFTPVNHTGMAELAGIRRVVMLPVWAGNTASAETAAGLDGLLRAALLEQKRFEVVGLDRAGCRARFGAEALDSTAVLPGNLPGRLAAEFGADALLLVDLTAYSPYRPQQIGWRAKLLRIADGVQVWTFDELFSATNPLVANSARHHFLGVTAGGAPADATPFALQSPSRFATYAAHAMFATLPPVQTGFPSAAVARSRR